MTRLGIYDIPTLPNSDSRRRKTLLPFPFQKLITLLSDLGLLTAQTLWKLDLKTNKQTKNRRCLGLCSKPLTWDIWGGAQELHLLEEFSGLDTLFTEATQAPHSNAGCGAGQTHNSRRLS